MYVLPNDSFGGFYNNNFAIDYLFELPLIKMCNMKTKLKIVVFSTKSTKQLFAIFESLSNITK